MSTAVSDYHHHQLQFWVVCNWVFEYEVEVCSLKVAWILA